MRIVVLGGGFGGVTAVRHLERLLPRRTHVEITLVSRENFFMLTPLLFEACSGRLELRHCAQPIRAALRRGRFIEATVESVDIALKNTTLPAKKTPLKCLGRVGLTPPRNVAAQETAAQRTHPAATHRVTAVRSTESVSDFRRLNQRLGDGGPGRRQMEPAGDLAPATRPNPAPRADV